MQLTANKRTKQLLPFVFFLSLIIFAATAYANPGVDFRGYYGAALLVRQGGNPYDYAQLTPILKKISGFKGNNPYFYPPWYCLFFIPMTYLPFRWAQVLWIFINIALFYPSLEWIWDAVNPKIPAWFRWMIFTIVNIMFGYRSLLSENSGFVIFFGLALILRGIKKEKMGIAGLGLAIMLLKPQTSFVIALMLAIWALKENSKLLLSTIFWLTSLLIVSLIFFPHWWNFDTNNFGLGISYYQDGADTITAKRAAATLYDWLRYFWGVTDWLFYVIVILFGMLGILILHSTWKHLHTPIYILTSTVLINMLLTPYALFYDYVILILPFFVILKSLPRLQKTRRWISITLLAAAGIVQFPLAFEFQAYWLLIFIVGAYLPVLQTASKKRTRTNLLTS